MIETRKKEVNKWNIFPDLLSGGKFRGYYTKDDPSLIKGVFPIGQNIKFTDNQTPTLRDGIEVIDSTTLENLPVKKAWNFERRDGKEIEMKVVGTNLYFRIIGEMEDFKKLEGSFQDSNEWTYAVISEATDINSRLNFCNGLDDWRIWTGVYAKYQSDNGSDEITVDTKLSEAAYLTSGTDLFIFPSIYASVTNGSFRITIDGTTRNIDGIDFTGVTTMDEVAAVIQAKIRTVTSGQETVIYKDRSIIIKSGISTNSSSISVLSTSTGTVGTDISGAGGDAYLDSDTGHGVTTARAILEFYNNGNLVDKEGNIIYYDDVDGYTFKGCSALPANKTVGDILVQGTKKMTSSYVIKSSLAIAHDGRLHSRSEVKRSVSNYSKIDNPDDWTTGSTDGDGGAKEIEQGGPITAYAHDESKLYIFKKRMIKTLEYIGTGSRIDVPKYGTIKPTDDKSITVGAIGSKSTFHAPNGIIFTTEDKQLVFLTREENIDYPQLKDISDSIKPTFQKGVHDEASGIVYKSKVYYAYKQDSKSSYNDAVLVFDLIRGIWYPPIIGWNVSDWTIVNGELHFHSSINSNSYNIIDSKTDEGLGFSTSLRTWYEDFGLPQIQKTCSYIMLEIYLQENSEVKLTVLYDEDGYSGQEEFTLKGDDKNNRFSSVEYNPFGLNSFGTEVFGSNPDIFGMKKHRYMIELKKNIEFFNIAIQLSTDLPGVNYELLRFGYLLDSYYELPNKKYLKGIN